MCWNKEVSIITYITVMVMVIILFKRNSGPDRHIALFSGIFVTIQLLEFFIWLSIENNNRTLNDYMTRLVLIFLWAQPLANTFMAYKGATNFKARSILMFLLIVFILLFLVSLVNSIGGFKFESDKGGNCHLVWKRKINEDSSELKSGFNFMANHPSMTFIYILGLFIPLLFIKPLKKGILLSVVGLLLLIISRKMSSQEEFSSWWCWIAGIFTLVALLYKTS